MASHIFNKISLACGIHWLAPNIGAIIYQIVFRRKPGHMKLLQQMVVCGDAVCWLFKRRCGGVSLRLLFESLKILF
ncbi:hypothetical protein CHS0354_022773 [Potamilus streckersoni]|uniref:Uncharacterized protein n=1 Tax=Potamilus streckersoni TaxID=2493646 RepID=A0AAE0VP15_9BIVA|nr:hypothetical protein CHS0354_022773 [Potamilus streckersoni]